MSIRKLGIFALVVAAAGAFVFLTGCKTEEIKAIPSKTSAAITGDNVLQVAEKKDDFKTFSRLVDQADLRDQLGAPGPYTVFAPTDSAFAKLPAGTIEDLQKPENKAKLRDLLMGHIVTGKIPSTDMTQREILTSLNGKTIKIQMVGNNVLVNDATVLGSDIFAHNGVIHPIDTVLMVK